VDNFKGFKIGEKIIEGQIVGKQMLYLSRPLSLPRGDTGPRRGLKTLSFG